MGTMEGRLPERMATSRPNQGVSFPSSVSALSRSTAFAFPPISFSIRALHDHIRRRRRLRRIGRRRWSFFLCRVRVDIAAMLHGGDGECAQWRRTDRSWPSPPQSPAVSSRVMALNCRAKAGRTTRGWLGWLQCRSFVSSAPLALSNGCRGRPIPLASGGRCDDTKGRLVRPPSTLTLNTGNFHLDDHGLQLQLDLQSAHAAHVPFFTLPFRFQRFHLCSPPRRAAVHLTHTLSH